MVGHVATAETEINATPAQVWAALVDPREIKKYMFGSLVETDWRPGSPIRWKGEYDGTSYEDKGEVLEIEPERRLTVTHFSPLSGQPDLPANYHTIVYQLTEQGDGTRVSLTQDNNGSEEEARHASANWATMLTGLKAVVEAG